jgi:hypothetical protein
MTVCLFNITNWHRPIGMLFRYFNRDNQGERQALFNNPERL